MTREIDVRTFTSSRVTPDRVSELRAAADRISEQLAGTHRIRIGQFDATTGNPAVLISEGAPPSGGDVLQRAIEHVQRIGPALGIGVQAPDFAPDPHVLETSSGAKAANLEQRYRGLPIFQAALTVRFAPDGALLDTVGSTITVGDERAVAPALTVAEAVVRAAEHVSEPDAEDEAEVDQFGQPMPAPRVDIGGFEPRVRATFNSPERHTVLAAGPFAADIPASLLWFARDEGIALAWTMLLTMPEYGQYRVIVDAGSGEILYCHQTVRSVAAVGNVYRRNGAGNRQMTPFPRMLGDLGLVHASIGQREWRSCQKCDGLFFNGAGSQGVCPLGGAHDMTASGEYRLVLDASDAPGQHDWRWCRKCQGLFFGGSATPGVCPAGGGHDQSGSGSYSLLVDSPLSPGQSNWRSCRKCEGLWYAGNAAGGCPAGGGHDQSGSGDYTLSDNAPPLPGGLPHDWVASTQTVGNATDAHLGDAGSPMTGVVQSGTLTFAPAAPTGDDQKVLNIFYYNGVMHDYFYLLGFTEAAGNFQEDNFGRGGAASDRVDARSHPGAVWGTANMSTPVDGSNPTMNMGLVVSTNRHTAFDSDVVYHEFMHGVTGRLVGGPTAADTLNSPQSGGMGEGWGDYVACTINRKAVLADWLLNDDGGMREFPYDPSFPDDFGDLGTGRYVASVHNIGEIWCATLVECNRRTEPSLAMQLVVDALKLSPANPSFLNMRDAILTALDQMHAAGRIDGKQRDGAWQGIWAAFCRFGMGPQARSNGAQLSGIVADRVLGQDNWRLCRKCSAMFFAGQSTQGVCPAGGAHDRSGSANYDIVTNMPAAPGQHGWRSCRKCQGLVFGGNATQGICPAGGAHDTSGSGDYALIENAPGAPGQHGWRSCQKCEGLWFSGATVPGGICPAGGTHDGAGSGDYSPMDGSP